MSLVGVDVALTRARGESKSVAKGAEKERTPRHPAMLLAIFFT